MTNNIGRDFLFLQGPHGLFLDDWTRCLNAPAGLLWRVGFNAGDAGFWPAKSSYKHFTQIIDVWATAVGVIIYNNITDIIRYGDSRPVHALAIKVLIKRLSKESEIKTGVGLQMLTKFQGTFASQSHRWR